MKRKPEPLQIGKNLPKQLLVEGSNDFHALCQLFEYRKIPAQFGIKEKNGYPRLLETLDEEVRASCLTTLGIIVDADESSLARWQSLRNRLIALGYTDISSQPDLNGMIAYPITDPELPTVGVWIMPDNQAPGILENFISFLIPNRETNPLWQYATQCVAAIPEGHQVFPDVRMAKALLHTWLAWQVEPGKPIGQAIAARYLDPETEAADRFIEWVKRLFEIS
jgi:hypothetical protein